ncbi:MAG: RNA-binding S4 domain-containing protein [Ardenticatenales bacterium]|nr:RNA-binding S4 domain-containing protein [Ardenticatenales bacterium]
MPVDNQGREYIDLQQFMKLTQLLDTGGHAKQLIQGGEVLVNGEVETRRRRKLYAGDEIEFFGETFIVEAADEDEESGAAL